MTSESDGPLAFPMNELKGVAIGLALVTGMLALEGKALLNSRPSRIDLPILAFVAYPLIGLLTAGRAAGWDVTAMVLHRTLAWLVPYAAARRYLGDAEGARRIAITVVVATLAYVPVCAVEAIMGPKWYLAGWIYGIPHMEGSVNRLGGWRPEAFFHSGILLASWMATAAVLACWLWLGRLWKPRWGPAWWPALILVLNAVACRGIYGYVTLLLGICAVVFTQIFRTRLILVVLMLAAPLYLAARASGAWDAEPLTRLAERLGRASSISARIGYEDLFIAAVVPRAPFLGFGVYPWHGPLVGEKVFVVPDAGWLPLFWSGGAVGLALCLVALEFVPAGLALRTPTSRPDREEAASPIWNMALYVCLYWIEMLNNYTIHPTVALAVGSLVGAAVGVRARGSSATRTERNRTSPIPVPELVPASMLAGFACLLYVFGHGPVPGFETVKLIGGLGAVLLFAASGWVGDWASRRYPLGRLATFAGLFALLGISFNLALYPTRTVWSCDILQSLAMTGLIVACGRRIAAGRPWMNVMLAVVPLAVQFLLGPLLPEFPGRQYLVAGKAVDLSPFPLCPWLTFAAIGAWSRHESMRMTLIFAVGFSFATALTWGTDSGSSGPSKVPMNLSYALLGCSSVMASVVLARLVASREPAARVLGWLGRNWLIFFYLQFALVAVLARTSLRSPGAVWLLMAAGTLTSTWLVSVVASPISGWFNRWMPWVALLGVVCAVAAWPGLPENLVREVASIAGMIFAAQVAAMTSLVLEARTATNARASASKASDASLSPGRTLGDLAINLLRFTAVLALLATPELLQVFTGSHADPALESSPPAANSGPPSDSRPIPDGLPDSDLSRRLREWSKSQSQPLDSSKAKPPR
jgi:hypothetical protein